MKRIIMLILLLAIPLVCFGEGATIQVSPKDETGYTTKMDGYDKFYDINGNETSREFIIKDERDGMWIVYSNDGRVLHEIPYKNGKKEGMMKTYDYNGNLIIERPFKNGKMEGIVRSYYENGNKKGETFRKEGLLHGTWRRYVKNGNMIFERLFKDGKEIKSKKDNNEGSD